MQSSKLLHPAVEERVSRVSINIILFYSVRYILTVPRTSTNDHDDICIDPPVVFRIPQEESPFSGGTGLFLY